MKEAVVFILDASPSMNTPYPKDSPEKGTTRLSCAKEAIESMLANLMLQSKQNEACVIVLKTHDTMHHKIAPGQDLEEEAVPFRNLTELTNGVTKPTVDLLRRLNQVETEDDASDLQGDFCDGIILAADALFERTYKKKYQRKIVLLTDAEHKVIMDVPQILTVVDSLRSMECQLEVLGLDFGMSAEYEEPASADTATKIKQEDTDEVMHDQADEQEEDSGSETEDEDDEEESDQVIYSSKEDREKLLISLTEKTGGKVVAASSMQQILHEDKGKRITTATKYKFDFSIAPGIVVEGRQSIMFGKDKPPTLQRAAVYVDHETNKPMVNELNQPMTEDVRRHTKYIDEDNPDDVVDAKDKTRAVRYGADLIPMSTFDYAALKTSLSAPRLQILGYVSKDSIPDAYLMGPPNFIFGQESQKTCAAIAALSQALERLNKVAICTFSKTKTSDPVLGALWPYTQDDSSPPSNFVFMRLPFAGETNTLDMDSFEAQLESEKNEQKSKACDDLIDAMMLPNDALDPKKVPSYYLRSWNQTLLKRAVDPEAEVVNTRSFGQDDPMTTPPEVMKRAIPAIDAFRGSFPVTMKKTGDQAEKKQMKRKGRKIFTYKDFLKEE